MFIFPGVGYGATACGAQVVSDHMFYEAARKLSLEVSEKNLACGKLYPDIENIRQITASVAKGICDVAVKEGLNTVPRPACGWLQHL